MAAVSNAVLSVLVAKPLGWMVALGGAIGGYLATILVEAVAAHDMRLARQVASWALKSDR